MPRLDLTPHIEALLERLEKLEERVKELEGDHERLDYYVHEEVVFDPLRDSD
jgi:hypothetical protein